MPLSGPDPASRPRIRFVHWVRPAVAACSLLLAFVFALAHHLFYTYWHGKTVQSDTQQQWLIRTGTAFAVLVHSCLVVPTSYSFVQQVWLSLAKRPTKVLDIDTLFNVLGNAGELFNLKLWLARPTLLLTAIAIWCIPIGSIIPPGTLTVRLSSRKIPQTLNVSTFNFTTWNYSAGYSASENDFVMGPASGEVNRKALASLTSFAIVQQNAPAADCAFTMSTFAPALKCESSSSQALQSLMDRISALNSSLGPYGYYDLEYLSWVPPSGFDGDAASNFNHVPMQTTTFDPLDQGSQNSTQIFFFSQQPGGRPGIGEGPGLISCSLHNASYALQFDFRNTQQAITISQRTFLNDIATMTSNSSDATFTDLSYLSIMEAFGQALTGQIADVVGNNWTNTSDSNTLATSTVLFLLPETYGNTSFADLVEEMFLNITFSMLSSDLLTSQHETSPSQNASITTFSNTYSYKPSSLLISYGVVLVIGLLICLIGVHALLQNGFSFNQNFSTFLRTTRDTTLNDENVVTEGMMNGAEPCENRLKNVKLVYRKHVGGGDGVSAGFVPASVSSFAFENQIYEGSTSATLTGDKANSKSSAVTIDPVLLWRDSRVNSVVTGSD